MKRLRRKGKVKKQNISYTSARAIRSLIARYEEYGKGHCLDIGLPSKNDKYQTVDVKPGGDYQGDVRVAFAPGFTDKLSEHPDLELIPRNHFKLVKATHFVEHISWIYQDFLFDWIYELLADGGMFYAATPNLEFVTRVYLKNLNRMKKGMPVKYPIHEHAYLDESVQTDLQRWVSFKLFSGQSPGDEHCAMYDGYLLNYLLRKKFENVRICADEALLAVAFKPTTRLGGVDAAVEGAIS